MVATEPKPGSRAVLRLAYPASPWNEPSGETPLQITWIQDADMPPPLSYKSSKFGNFRTSSVSEASNLPGLLTPSLDSFHSNTFDQKSRIEERSLDLEAETASIESNLDISWRPLLWASHALALLVSLFVLFRQSNQFEPVILKDAARAGVLLAKAMATMTPILAATALCSAVILA